jgi:hypothetical protein
MESRVSESLIVPVKSGNPFRRGPDGGKGRPVVGNVGGKDGGTVVPEHHLNETATCSRAVQRSPVDGEVNVDFAHTTRGPAEPHIGYQGPGKSRVRGHILLPDVPAGRSRADE